MNLIEELFGTGEELSSLQMGCRALVVFFITLILIRMAGRRAFGKKSAFDNIIVIMLGALLSRVVTGASPFFPTVIAALVLVLVHRLMAWLSLYSDAISRFAKGQRRSLYKDGKINEKNMKRTLLSDAELLEGVRLKVNENSLHHVEEVFIEGSGEFSVVRKQG